jgi:hypothetical protein
MKDLANHEIVTLALFLLGGVTSNVDTEDIAIKANEIAPGRFTWRKYPAQINIDTVRKRLWDATKKEKGGYLLGSEKDGWLLTEEGIRFAKSKASNIKETSLSKIRLSFREAQWVRRERIRMLESQTLHNLESSGIDAITPQEAEAFFRIDDYVVGKARQRKLVRVLNALGSDPKLGPAIRILARKVRGGSNEGHE